MSSLSSSSSFLNHEVQHRQGVSRLIYSIWTCHGADESGLAAPMLDGRIDALGLYTMMMMMMTMSSDDNDEDKEDNDYNEDSIPETTTIIDHCSCHELSYTDFFNKYMLLNRPVMIDGLTETWNAASSWVDERGEPNVLAFSTLCGGSDIVPVHVQAHGGFTQTRPVKEEWCLDEYVSWWMSHHQKKNQSKKEDDMNDEDEKEGMIESTSLYYLKDYKFAKSHPNNCHAYYDWPIFFQDDWLNEYTQGSYKFVYLGPKGTSTRLHADVLRSYSWSTNVCGIKRWYLIPPNKTYLLYDVFSRQLASHLQSYSSSSSQNNNKNNNFNNNSMLYPGLAKARTYAMEIIQYPGETIFVPSGWHHTVENMAPTLSINHNWLNGTNIHWSWEKMKMELEGLYCNNDVVSGKNNNNFGGNSGDMIQTPQDQQQGSNSSSSSSRKGSNISDSSQIGDDLYLLWMVISTKMKSTLKSSNMTSMDMFNMQKCLPILEEMSAFIHEGKDQGLTERCPCDIDDLIRQLHQRVSQ